MVGKLLLLRSQGWVAQQEKRCRTFAMAALLEIYSLDAGFCARINTRLL